MKHFTSVHDTPSPKRLAADALAFRNDPFSHSQLGKNKTLGLFFFNPSLRTRLSTQKAARNLGMEVIVMNVGQEGWALETEDGTVMDGGTAEHIKDAAAVMGRYCDIIGVRSFPTLQDREADYADTVIHQFVRHAGVPVVSLESAVLHPLQSLADLMTIEQFKEKAAPKIVMTWAPHPRALPQAVPNSFAEWMNAAGADFTIACPEGYRLDPRFEGRATVTHKQDEALRGADFVYAKNWSSYNRYGQILSKDPAWTLTEAKMALTNNARFMHCLPLRRNVIATDAVVDSPRSLIYEQAHNREFSAQAVLKALLGGD